MATRILSVFTIAAMLCVSAPFSTHRSSANAPVDAKTGEIVVRVIDDAGKTQSDAVVNVFVYDPDPGTFVAVPPDKRTDASGIVHLDWLLPERNYLIRARTPTGLIGYAQRTLRSEKSKLDVDLRALRSVAGTVHVHDESGAPVSGASIGEISLAEPDGGSIRFDPQHLVAIRLAANQSTASGDLRLPELPAGKVDVQLIHPDFAPAQLKGLDLGSRQAADLALSRGVKLKLRINAEPGLPPVEGLRIEFRHEPDRHGSTDLLPLAPLGRDGTTQISLPSGKYSWLALFHPHYLITPAYDIGRGRKLSDEPEFFQLPGGDGLEFRVQRLVRVRGHVLDEPTRRPVAGVAIDGKVPSHAEGSPLAHFTPDWYRASHQRTNERGEFELDLAAGPARLVVGRDFISPVRYYQIDVTADGSTVAPDILVRPIPRVHGVVLDQNGKRLPGAVVRFRGSELTYENQAVVTGAQGEFELSTLFMPVDPWTDEPQPERSVVAFDPQSPVAAERRIRLDDGASLDHVELRMKPQEYGALLTSYPDEFVPWMEGTVRAIEAKRLAAVSLVGKPAPELDGAAWLNADKPRVSLADFRGKYVLLQFWATWCGPCHRDMANVKLAYNLYKDKGLVVIGVHDNSMPLHAIKEDVAKNGLTYPIVVDHPDGRLYASYREHGMAPYYPSYVLIGPDGKILLDDRTVAGPTLSILKVEIIRQLVMTRGTTKR